MSFWGELKRRNIYKVGVAYAIVAWLIIQAAAIIFPHMRLPNWAVPLVIAFLIIGFPIALLLAWAYEVTPEGIKKTKEVPLSESITHLTGRKLNYILAGVIILGVAYIAFDKFYLDRRATKPEMVSTEKEKAPAVSDVEEAPKTIAVLPFDDLSPEKDQEYFVLGLSEEILNYLSNISGLHVTSKTSAFSFKGTNKTIQEIAEILGRDYILEGSVRKAGNELRITAQLIQVADDRHLWSKTYDRELKDIFAVQEDIAKAVADELKLTLGVGKSLKQLGGTDNEKAYELYLFAKGQYSGSVSLPHSSLLEPVDAALVLDPDFALAWALKASIISSLMPDMPADQLDTARDAYLTAMQRAIEIEPNLAEVYTLMGTCNTTMGKWIEAELNYRKASDLIADPYMKYKTINHLYYLAVGNFNKACDIFESYRRDDPLNAVMRGHYISGLSLVGNIDRAEEEYELGRAMFGSEWFWGNINIALVRIIAGDISSRDEVKKFWPIDEDSWDRIVSPEDALTELQRFYADEESLSITQMTNTSLCAAYFGSPEFALDAMEKAVTLERSYMSWIWYPVFHEVRQLPRFKEFIREIGLVDYWNKFGWPDICRQLDNGDFECD